MHRLALLFFAMASAVDLGATGPAAVVDWTRGATGGMTSSSIPGYTYMNLEDTEYTTAILNMTYRDSTTNTTRIESREIGKYGEGAIGNISGVLVHVGPKDDGCLLPLTKNLPSEPWVALIRRGNCNFDVKVENAYQSNAAGVIVFDNVSSSNLQKMMISRNRNISSIFTTKAMGEELAALVDNGTKVHVDITVGNHCLRPYGNINSIFRLLLGSSSVEGHPVGRLCHPSDTFSPYYSTTRRAYFKMSLTFCDPNSPSRRCLIATSVLFVSISFIVLMIISLAWLVFYYIQRFRYSHAKDRLARRLCSAAKKALSKIPTKNIRSEDQEMQGEGESCAVCIEPYKVSDVIRILPCRHEFHKSCIDPWLLEHRTCPMCKMDILKFYGFMFTGSQESILHIDIDDPGLSSSESHDLPSPTIITVGATAMITESHSRNSSDPIAGNSSDSNEQLPANDLAISRAPSPDELTPSLGHMHCTYMVVTEVEIPPSNSLTTSEKCAKSSNKDEMLQKDEQTDENISCDKVSTDCLKFSPTNLVNDSKNELDLKPIQRSCSELSVLSEHDSSNIGDGKN